MSQFSTIILEEVVNKMMEKIFNIAKSLFLLKESDLQVIDSNK